MVLPPTCPQCSSPHVNRLDEISNDSRLNYFRCDGCACVWTAKKDSNSGPVMIFFPPRSDDHAVLNLRNALEQA